MCLGKPVPLWDLYVLPLTLCQAPTSDTSYKCLRDINACCDVRLLKFLQAIRTSLGTHQRAGVRYEQELYPVTTLLTRVFISPCDPVVSLILTLEEARTLILPRFFHSEGVSGIDSGPDVWQPLLALCVCSRQMQWLLYSWQDPGQPSTMLSTPLYRPRSHIAPPATGHGSRVTFPIGRRLGSPQYPATISH